MAEINNPQYIKIRIDPEIFSRELDKSLSEWILLELLRKK